MKRTSKIRNIIIHKFHVWQEKIAGQIGKYNIGVATYMTINSDTTSKHFSIH